MAREAKPRREHVDNLIGQLTVKDSNVNFIVLLSAQAGTERFMVAGLKHREIL